MWTDWWVAARTACGDGFEWCPLVIPGPPHTHTRARADKVFEACNVCFPSILGPSTAYTCAISEMSDDEHTLLLHCSVPALFIMPKRCSTRFDCCACACYYRNKHGTCALTEMPDEHTFFKTVLKLHSKYNIQVCE